MKTIDTFVNSLPEKDNSPISLRERIYRIRHSLKFLIPVSIASVSCISGVIFLLISYGALEKDKVRDLNSLKQFQLQSVASYIRDKLDESEADQPVIFVPLPEFIIS